MSMFKNLINLEVLTLGINLFNEVNTSLKKK